jgi:hypothetical protein
LTLMAAQSIHLTILTQLKSKWFLAYLAKEL